MALTTGLVSYWKLDETGTGNASDSVGSVTLTNTGPSTYAAGLINNGGDLGATNSTKYFVATDNLGLTGTGDKTLNIWVNITTAPGVGTIYELFGHRTQLTTDRYFYLFYDNVGGTFRVSSIYSTAVPSTTTQTLTTGTWYMFTMVLASGTVSIYLNNSLLHTYSQGSFTAAQDYIYFGRTPDAAIQYSSAKFDEYGVWSRALDSTERGQLYNSGAGLQYPFSAGSSFSPRMSLLGVGR